MLISNVYFNLVPQLLKPAQASLVFLKWLKFKIHRLNKSEILKLQDVVRSVRLVNLGQFLKEKWFANLARWIFLKKTFGVFVDFHESSINCSASLVSICQTTWWMWILVGCLTIVSLTIQNWFCSTTRKFFFFGDW
jgi:hypothetical protein